MMATAETATIKASCLCGKAKHEITRPKSEFPFKQSFCHCHSCRHMTGTLCLTVINLPESYEPATDLIAKLIPFQFTKRLTQYFCSTCGSHMLAHNWIDDDDHSQGAQWDAMTGTFEKADGIFEPDAHEFIADTVDGGFSDFLPTFKDRQIVRWAKWPDKSDILPLYWRLAADDDGSQQQQLKRAREEEKLHAHCKCRGVNFWISRPSERSKRARSPVADLLVPHHSDAVYPISSWWLRDNDTKFLAGVCSCNSCRLDTGMEWMEWTFVPTVDITLDAEGERPFELPFGTLKAYQSSETVERYHCGVCGASVFFTSSKRDGLVDVAVGLLDSPEGARAGSWLEFTTDRLSFREDSIPRAEDLTLAVEQGLKLYGARSAKE